MVKITNYLSCKGLEESINKYDPMQHFTVSERCHNHNRTADHVIPMWSLGLVCVIYNIKPLLTKAHYSKPLVTEAVLAAVENIPK